MTQQSTEQAVQHAAPVVSNQASPADPAVLPAPAPAPANPEELDATRRLTQLVPVNESIRYRRRAQQAEQRAAELQQELDQQQRSRADLQAQLSAARRRSELLQRLADRGVIDLEAAVLLVEQRLSSSATSTGAEGQESGSAIDLQAVIEQLLKDKPYLARPRSEAVGTGESGRTALLAVPTLGPPNQGRRPRTSGLEMLRSAAQRATGTGRGAELENYLRLRRRAKN